MPLLSLCSLFSSCRTQKCVDFSVDSILYLVRWCNFVNLAQWWRVRDCQVNYERRNFNKNSQIPPPFFLHLNFHKISHSECKKKNYARLKNNEIEINSRKTTCCSLETCDCCLTMANFTCFLCVEEEFELRNK